MLSNDTRRRLVEGYKRMGHAKEIAKAYGVSEREVYKLVAQMRDTGSVDLQVSKRGRKSVLTEEDLKRIDQELQAQPDITLRELKEKLNLRISESALGKIVRGKLGYSRKKKVIHASEQERPRRAKKTG